MSWLNSVEASRVESRRVDAASCCLIVVLPRAYDRSDCLFMRTALSLLLIFILIGFEIIMVLLLFGVVDVLI